MAERVFRDAEDFKALSKACKQVSPEIRKDLTKGLRAAGRPLIPKTRKAFRDGLPKRGGVNNAFARRPIRLKLATGVDPGISVVAAKTDPRIDAGRLGHPVFNRRRSDGSRVFVVQQVTPGLFSETLEREAPSVIEPLNDVMDRIADRLASG